MSYLLDSLCIFKAAVIVKSAFVKWGNKEYRITPMTKGVYINIYLAPAASVFSLNKQEFHYARCL